MGKNILIFGGSGFVGTHLTRYLVNKTNIEKIVVADLVKPKITNKKVVFKEIDIREPISSNVVGESFEEIINLAAIHRTPGHKKDEYFETNIKGAKNICDFAKSQDIKKIIFTSSISVYGPSEELKSEESIPKPNIPYGISKTIAEYVHRDWYNSGDSTKKLVIIRPAVIFGKGEKGNFTRIAHALRNNIFIYPGRKDTIKACCYVKDLCRFIIMQMKKDEGFSLNNFCYPERITVKNITDAFTESLNYNKPFIIVPKFIVDIGAFVLGAISSVIPFLKKYGFDKQRVEKLTKSTNISSKKLNRINFTFKYPLNEALEDWQKDCGSNKLY